MKKTKKLVISISYGNYMKGGGGTDKVLLAHQKMFNEKNIDVLYLYNYRSNEEAKYNVWYSIFNDKELRFNSTRKIEVLLERYIKQGGEIQAFFLHHLMNSSIKDLKKLFTFCPVPIFFYLHDYMTICPATGLLCNDSGFCGMSRPSNDKCKGCNVEIEKNVKRFEEIQKFIFEYEDRITFIAPSEMTKKLWLEVYYQYKDKVVTIYHQRLNGQYTGNMEFLDENKPLKVAFVGYQKALKGWKHWVNAISKIQETNHKYEFYQFGWGDEKYPYLKQIAVNFQDDLNAMVNALRKEQIDCAVLWSICPETYAFTYYESWAANAFIITNEMSGNICAQVEMNKNGIVLRSPEDMEKILDNEAELRTLINAYRSRKEYGPLELLDNDEVLKFIKNVNVRLEKIEEFDLKNELTVNWYMLKCWGSILKHSIVNGIKNVLRYN